MIGLKANKQMTGVDGHEGILFLLERVHPGGPQEANKSDRASVSPLQCRIWSSGS